MNSLYFLIPLSLIIVSIGVALFIWAVRGGQMDDLEGPGHSILYEDDEALIPDDAKRRPIHREQTEVGRNARHPGRSG